MAPPEPPAAATAAAASPPPPAAPETAAAAAPGLAPPAATEQDAAFMRRAIELSAHAGIEAKCGKCFGAVVVKDGRVVGEGFNQVFSQNDPTWHGEIHAIREAGRALSTPSLQGCTLYSSTMPCPMCTAAIYWSRIERVWYGAENEDVNAWGAFETGGDYEQGVFRGREHLLPPEQRTGVPFACLLRAEAADVFRRYAELPAEQRPCY